MPSVIFRVLCRLFFCIIHTITVRSADCWAEVFVVVGVALATLCQSVSSYSQCLVGSVAYVRCCLHSCSLILVILLYNSRCKFFTRGIVGVESCRSQGDPKFLETPSFRYQRRSYRSHLSLSEQDENPSNVNKTRNFKA